jgi:hypothetical protein
MRVGDLVRFRENDRQREFLVGLLVRYDSFLKVGEIMVGDRIYYATGRLIETYQRGLK